MCSRSVALDLRRKAVILIRMRLWMKMGVDRRVVMCNEAAARQICTHGNNEVLLR
jgi:hypothetical protein